MKAVLEKWTGFTEVHGSTVSPDNKSVYVTGANDDALGVFDRDTSSDSPCLKNYENQVEGIDYPKNFTISPG